MSDPTTTSCEENPPMSAADEITAMIVSMGPPIMTWQEAAVIVYAERPELFAHDAETEDA